MNIIHAIISKPRLLLLDEPTASLDSKTKGEVVKLLVELKQAGTTMIGVFHDHETMMDLADQEYRFEVPQQAMV